MGNGRWQNNRVFAMCHLRFAIQDAFFSILLVEGGRASTVERSANVRRSVAPSDPWLVSRVRSFMTERLSGPLTALEPCESNEHKVLVDRIGSVSYRSVRRCRPIKETHH